MVRSFVAQSISSASRFVAPGVLAALLCSAVAPTATAQSVFTQVGQFSLPAGVDAWDVAPDGRVWGIVGTSIVRQTAVNASTYTPIGSVPSGTVASFGASFLRISTTGVLAIGDNNFGAGARVHLLEAANLSTSAPTATSSLILGNYDARWSGSSLYVTGAGSDFVPFVSRVDYSDAATPLAAVRVITGIGGASGGVDFNAGRLFTGVGFDGGGFVSGDIRSFNLAAINSNPVATLYGSGTAIPGGPALSASTLAFDSNGTLLVGGFTGGEALAINITTGTRTSLSPAGSTGGYAVAFNAFTGEALISQGGVAYRYSVPAPAAVGAVAMMGVLAARRRR